MDVRHGNNYFSLFHYIKESKKLPFSEISSKVIKSLLEENKNLKKLDDPEKHIIFLHKIDMSTKKRYKEEIIYSGSTMVIVF